MPETKPAETRPVSRVTAPCCDGSASAALWHRINGTDPCDASRDAQNAYHQEQRKNPAPRRKAGRVPGELYGDELGAAVLAHLIAHPVGLTSREIARAFGYRNPANQRLRARAATTRRARGHLTTHTSGPHAQPRRPLKN